MPPVETSCVIAGESGPMACFEREAEEQQKHDWLFQTPAVILFGGLRVPRHFQLFKSQPLHCQCRFGKRL